MRIIVSVSLYGKQRKYCQGCIAIAKMCRDHGASLHAHVDESVPIRVREELQAQGAKVVMCEGDVFTKEHRMLRRYFPLIDCGADECVIVSDVESDQNVFANCIPYLREISRFPRAIAYQSVIFNPQDGVNEVLSAGGKICASKLDLPDALRATLRETLVSCARLPPIECPSDHWLKPRYENGYGHDEEWLARVFFPAIFERGIPCTPHWLTVFEWMQHGGKTRGARKEIAASPFLAALCSHE